MLNAFISLRIKIVTNAVVLFLKTTKIYTNFLILKLVNLEVYGVSFKSIFNKYNV